MMKQLRSRRTWIIIIVLLAVLALNQIPLPYYYSQPGEASPLHDMVTVSSGYDEQGEFYLTTIRQQRANIPLYIWSRLSEYRDLTPTDQFLREGETDEEYFHRQNRLMNSSQEAAKIAAYKQADRQYEVEYQGVEISEVIEGMDAKNHLQADDLITELNGEKVRTLEKMNGRLEGMEAGTEVTLTVKRGEETLQETVEISNFPEDMTSSSRAGLGLLYPYTKRNVQFDPNVEIDAGSIGGPSAGLMFSLEIYNQLTGNDLTDGIDAAGTGTIDDEGNVGPIGGISEKIVAAENSNVDVFFAPDTDVASSSNYEQAEKTASDINADMTIVPVQHMEDAVSYLKDRDSAS